MPNVQVDSTVSRGTTAQRHGRTLATIELCNVSLELNPAQASRVVSGVKSLAVERSPHGAPSRVDEDGNREQPQKPAAELQPHPGHGRAAGEQWRDPAGESQDGARDDASQRWQVGERLRIELEQGFAGARWRHGRHS